MVLITPSVGESGKTYCDSCFPLENYSILFLKLQSPEEIVGIPKGCHKVVCNRFPHEILIPRIIKLLVVILLKAPSDSRPDV